MFNLEKENIDTRYLLLLISIAYLFSIAIRMIWVYQFNDYDAFKWQNQLMINTNDGYIWGTSVLNELGTEFENNPRVVDMYKYGAVFFTYLAVKILPFSLDTIMLYMPAVISSLVVVPIILIARLYKLTLWGFFAALIGSIAWSYYNRTMIGYYDTDMFSAMAPMFILYFLMRTIENESLPNALFSALSILIYPFLYDAGLSIVYAIGLIYMVYMVTFHKKDEFTYQSIILIAIALMGIPWFVKLALILGLYFLFTSNSFAIKQLIIASVGVVVVFLISGNVVSILWAKIAVYTIRGSESEGLKFFQVAQTVREAGTIPFSTMANRISGSSLGVIVSLIGYVLLVIKYRPFILALPLIGIGVFSLWGGLRFTVYAVPVAAMSSVFLFYTIANFSQKNIIRYPLIITLTIAMLYPNIMHIVGYKVPTVFNKAEVEILDKLKTIATPKDYTLTWWDYGYPIWYYSNTNTLIDGGKHSQDNFIISQILNSDSPRQSANLSRLAVETYVNSEYKIVANEIFKNKTPQQIDPNIMLDELRLDDYSLPAKTRDVFIYLPNRMLDIFPTVTLFSNLDLVSGEKWKRPFYYKSNQFQDSKDSINLGNNIKIIKAKGQIQIGMQSIGINNFVTTVYDNNKILRKQVQKLNPNGNINVIFMKNYNQFLVLDNKMYNSLFIQMFVLENYDKSLFEPVILEPLAKVYRLKI
ncbi:MAG: peptide-binding protein [Epsilonproteobacteria bacterium]|nr:MAG: peptide-binding protein [Campylobacterota bacterium]